MSSGVVSALQIERYTVEIAADVASLIEECFAEHRKAPPLTFLAPPEPWTRLEDLLATLTSDALYHEASHVAIEDGRPVSTALAIRGPDGPGWWRIATAPRFRRQGLAAACVAAGESELAAAGQHEVRTHATVDSRWEAADGFRRSLAYDLDDPDRRNITMVAPQWTPRPVELPDGYQLDTLRENHLDEWMAVRNEVFGGAHGPGWFRERFMSRPDYDPAGWKIARHEGRIVGISAAVCTSGERDPECLRGAQIEWVGVLHEHRGLHLGEELVVACMNYASERDFLPVLLITQPFRVPAIRLYEKLGFATTAAWHRWVKRLI